MGPIHKSWIYLNYIEDEKDRIEETKTIMSEMNWRLRPETAKEIDKAEKQQSSTASINQNQEKYLDKLFEGNIINARHSKGS